MTTTTKTRKTKEECLAAFNKLQAALPDGKTVTRDAYRKDSGIPAADWEYHFGTFAELKRSAEVVDTRADAKLKNAIAKTVAVSRRDAVAKERAGYADVYTRTDSSRYKTMLVGSDLHDKEIDPFWLRVFVDTARRVQPDNITLGGDVFDLPEFGRYNVDPREWDAVGRIKFAHQNIFKPLREAAPDAQFDLIEGNHECITPDTEVLTTLGWMTAGNYAALKAKPPIASFDLVDHNITYNRPVAVATQGGREVFEVKSTFKHERITSNHNLVTKVGTLKSLEAFGDNLNGDDLLYALSRPDDDHTITNMDANLVRLAVWVITHATINQTEGDYKYWLSFNHAPSRIKRRIKAVVQRIHGINWIEVKNGIEVEGPALAGILELITGMEHIPTGTRWNDVPDWFERLANHYGEIVAEELTWASTQGFMAPRTSYYKGWGHDMGEALQWFMVQRNVPCAMKKLPMGQYVLVFNETGKLERWRGKPVKKQVYYRYGDVVSIQTKDGTLITRVEGKINFTGNCRLVKHLADFSPATRAILGDLHGMTIGDLFGLKDFEINYVAKADLKAYSAKEHDRELQNNYRIYHDNVLVHHFPHARHMGMPGVNGHHHSHQVWPMFNIHQGAYEWHQLGAGHKRSASYCEGERWHNGFALIHIDTLTKSVNIEYVPVTNMAVVGGKFYTREPHEVIT